MHARALGPNLGEELGGARLYFHFTIRCVLAHEGATDSQTLPGSHQAIDERQAPLPTIA